MSKKKNILLSISLLASNRKDTIKKCLDSLQPIRDAVPSELIIVDTGCDDELHQMLVEYADIVTRFTWCNDFSAARNAGLRLASGEWFLYIDDDEWFVETKELVDFFTGNQHKKYNYGHYIQRNYIDKEGTQYSDSWVTRFFRLEKGTHFVSKIHEYMEPVHGNFIGLNAIVDHYGYVYQTEEDKIKHFERNKVLLMDMMKEEPDVLRWRVQLEQEYRSVDRYQEMYEFGMECLDLMEGRDDRQDNIDLGTFYAAGISGLIHMKRYDEAIELCKRAEEDSRNTEMCRAAICLYRSELCFHKENWKEAKHYAEEYFKWYEKLQGNEILIFLQKMALLVNEIFDEMMVQRAYSLLICAGLKEKDTSALKKYLSKLGWDKKHIYVFNQMTETLVEAMALLPYEDIFLSTAELIHNHSGFWNIFCKEVRRWELVGKEGIPNIVNVLAKLGGDEWYLYYIKLLDAEQKDRKDEYPLYLRGIFKTVQNVFLSYDNLCEFAERNKISLEEYYLEVPHQKWGADLGEFIEKASARVRNTLRDYMTSIRTKENWRYSYFDMRMTEVDIVVNQDCGSYKGLHDLFMEFARQTLSFYRSYYRQEVFEHYVELLPEPCQAAVYIWRALSLQDTDREQAMEALKNSVAVYPLFTEAIKTYIRLYGAEQLRKEKAARDEMRELTGKIKNEVRSLMDKGMLKEAAAVMEQLKRLLPQDLEVANMNLQIRLRMLKEGQPAM